MDGFIQVCCELRCGARLLVSAERGRLQDIVNVDANHQVSRRTGLGELEHDRGGGAERKRGRVSVTDEAMTDQLKQALIGPEHKVLWVLCASCALEARLALVLLVECNLTCLNLVLLDPL